jgi:hypothetical protein
VIVAQGNDSGIYIGSNSGPSQMMQLNYPALGSFVNLNKPSVSSEVYVFSCNTGGGADPPATHLAGPAGSTIHAPEQLSWANNGKITNQKSINGPDQPLKQFKPSLSERIGAAWQRLFH